MTKAETLAELLINNRSVKRTVSYLESESSERVVGYGELYERALGILFHLQKLGARPGDKLIIYLANNEQFLDAFWAGMLGGIVPVPVALGISDEHKHKLLRIAKKWASHSSTPIARHSIASARLPVPPASRRCSMR
jgi:acyl-CoA synthetase (AMP-forming)/AMP-acid ligase II